MLSLGSQAIFYYNDPVDMRKGFNGLSDLVAESFPGKLLSGAIFIFLNKRCNLIKIIYWDYDGLALWYKRLEKGTFKALARGNIEITRQEFSLILGYYSALLA